MKWILQRIYKECFHFYHIIITKTFYNIFIKAKEFGCLLSVRCLYVLRTAANLEEQKSFLRFPLDVKESDNMAYANTFKRREMKFLLTKSQYKIVSEGIASHMTEDEFGLHTILNIYFDNVNDDLVRYSLGKPVFKQKLRLRAYGKAAADDDKAFLEIKKKYRGITYKRRLEMSYKELFDYSASGVLPEKRGQVFEEIDYLKNKMNLLPKIVICYDREAFFGNDDKEFRVTFDSNIRYRTTDVDLRSGDYGKRLVNAPYRIMEIKSAGAIPRWLVDILSENRIYHGSFSKYGTIYMNQLKEASNKFCLPAVSA